MEAQTFATAALNGLARVHYPEVSPFELNEWVGDSWPEGEWAVDLATIHGLDKVLRALDVLGEAFFTVLRKETGAYIVREAVPAIGLRAPEAYEAEYPEAPERGPRARWTREGEAFALRCFIVSRAELGASGFRAIRTLWGTRFELYR